MPIRVFNRTRETILAQAAEVADTSASRRRGLLGRERFEPGEGLWIVPCEAVHCFFMKFAIDVVYLNRRRQVVKVRPGLKPWRLSGCLSAHSVLELPAGMIESSGTAKGDQLEFEKLV